jgi:hypothetical protein
VRQLAVLGKKIEAGEIIPQRAAPARRRGRPSGSKNKHPGDTRPRMIERLVLNAIELFSRMETESTSDRSELSKRGYKPDEVQVFLQKRASRSRAIRLIAQRENKMTDESVEEYLRRAKKDRLSTPQKIA